MIALLGSSLLNLGIIFLIFSVIIYIVKNKISDMDKKITSLTTIMEETIKTINTQCTMKPVTSTTVDVKLEKPVVSDDENSDGDDSDDSDDSDDDDDKSDNNSVSKISIDDDGVERNDDITIKEILSNKIDYTQVTQDIEKEPLLCQVNLLQSNSDVEQVLGTAFQSHDSIDDNITVKSHVDDFNNTPEPGVFKEKEEEEEEDYNLLNVKELKKLVSGKGGKVSGKTKDELVLYLNENKE